jgi:HSP20 family protein
MKKIFKYKILLATVSVLMGVFLSVLFIEVFNCQLFASSKNKEKEQNQNIESEIDSMLNALNKNLNDRNKLFNDFFNHDFFENNIDPFKEMEKMRKKMQESFNSIGRGFDNSFDGWFSNRFGGGSAGDFSTREDKNFVYYDIEIKSLSGNDVNIKIENNLVTVTGNIENIKEVDRKDFKSKQTIVSTFNRTFPIPKGVDSDNAQIEVKNNKIIIKFPKSNNFLG